MKKSKKIPALFLALFLVVTLAGCGSSGSKGSQPAAAAATKQTDVVVVGSGMSGMSAAIEVASQGAKVVLLEKQAVLGGNTNVAEGMFAAESPLQKEMGITGVDQEGLLRAEFEFSNYKVDGNLWKNVMSHSGEDIQWLLDMGVKFEAVISTGAGARTWHVYEGFGKTVINEHMKPTAEKLGVEIMLNTPATELIMNNGQVAGVKATTKDGKTLDINAKAVILATGGFGSNEEMVKELTGLDTSKYIYRGMPGHDGDGIKMAQTAGALTGERAILMTLGNSLEGTDLKSQLGVVAGQEPSLWVNQDAKRFCNEDVIWYYTRGSNAILTQNKTFTVLDSTEIDRLVNKDGLTVGWGMYNMPGKKMDQFPTELQKALDSKNPNVFKADTLEELATKMGIDPATFVKTVNDYNSFCVNGKDLDYGKDPQYLYPVKTAPFYGFSVKAINLTSCGGIRVNEKNEAVNKDYQSVKGLYVAGLDCDGFTGDTYGLTLPGSAQGLSCYTGRNAARNAAQFAKTN